MASATVSFIPRFRMVSIIPGIENLAPERTETRSGDSASPNLCQQLFQPGQSLIHFLPDGVRKLIAIFEINPACGCRNCKSGWDGQPRIGHLGKARTFAAQNVFHVALSFCLTTPK